MASFELKPKIWGIVDAETVGATILAENDYLLLGKARVAGVQTSRDCVGLEANRKLCRFVILICRDQRLDKVLG
jgi:hypothetical protein